MGYHQSFHRAHIVLYSTFAAFKTCLQPLRVRLHGSFNAILTASAGHPLVNTGVHLEAVDTNVAILKVVVRAALPVGLAQLPGLDVLVALLGNLEEVILGIVGALVGVDRLEARVSAKSWVPKPGWAGAVLM